MELITLFQGDTIYRILYVDDELSPLELTKLYLKNRFGIQVLTRESPEDVLKFLEADCVDLIFPDYEMPGMNVICLLREVKRKYSSMLFIVYAEKG